MAEVIIGSKTYKNLVTFKKCSSTGGGLFPWAFVTHNYNLDASANGDMPTFSPAYFTELSSDRYIAYPRVSKSPLAVAETYHKHVSTSDKTYYKLVCEDDLAYTTQSGPLIMRRCTHKATAIAQTFRVSIGNGTNNTQILSWEAPTKNETSQIAYYNIPNPSANNQVFTFYIRHSGTANRSFSMQIDPYDGVANHWFSLSGSVGEKGNYNSYTKGYNGGTLNYNLFWNICYLAELDNSHMFFSITITG